MTNLLHFAYGSNMSLKQMKDRCPGSRPIGIAVLRDHELAFTRIGIDRKCGVADVVPLKGSHVWGRLFELSPLDLRELDKHEGAARKIGPNSYDRVTMEVDIDGDPSERISVQVYVVPSSARGSHLPNRAYMDLIISGAMEASLPLDYRQMLARITVC